MFNLISSIEKTFVLNNLKSDFREESEKLTSFRKIHFEQLKEDGQVILHLGKTKILSQIFAKLVCPDKSRPNDGIIMFNVN